MAGDKDRRKHRRNDKRFQVKRFTFVKLWSESDEDIGQLLDINKSGLSLRYFVKDQNPSNFSHLSIVSSECDLVIDKIPFTVVSDTELANGSQSDPIIFRRAVVQFGELTSRQISELDDFLKKHTKVLHRDERG
jgi:hypothetical protein